MAALSRYYLYPVLSAGLLVIQMPASAQVLPDLPATDTRVDSSWHCTMPYLPPCYTFKIMTGAFSVNEFRTLEAVKGKVMVSFTLDTLNRQLNNFHITGDWLMERRSGRRTAWQQYDEQHPAPAAVAALLPALRHYVLRKVQPAGPSRQRCMRNEQWAIPITLL